MGDEPKKIGIMQIKKFLGIDSLGEFKKEWIELSSEERDEIRDMVAESLVSLPGHARTEEERQKGEK